MIKTLWKQFCFWQKAHKGITEQVKQCIWNGHAEYLHAEAKHLLCFGLEVVLESSLEFVCYLNFFGFPDLDYPQYSGYLIVIKLGEPFGKVLQVHPSLYLMPFLPEEVKIYGLCWWGSFCVHSYERCQSLEEAKKRMHALVRTFWYQLMQ